MPGMLTGKDTSCAFCLPVNMRFSFLISCLHFLPFSFIMSIFYLSMSLIYVLIGFIGCHCGTQCVFFTSNRYFLECTLVYDIARTEGYRRTLS